MTDKQLIDNLNERCTDERPWQFWLSVYWAPSLRDSLKLITEDPQGYSQVTSRAVARNILASKFTRKGVK